MRTFVCVALVLVVLMAEFSAIEARRRGKSKKSKSIEKGDDEKVEDNDVSYVADVSGTKAPKGDSKAAKGDSSGSKGASNEVVCKEECSVTGASCKVVQSGACKPNTDGTLYCQCGGGAKGAKGEDLSSYIAACDGGAEGDACEVTGVCKHHYRHGHRCTSLDTSAGDD